MPGGHCRFVSHSTIIQMLILTTWTIQIFSITFVTVKKLERVSPLIYKDISNSRMVTENHLMLAFLHFKRRLSSKPHIEVAMGSAAQAIAYCEKDGVFWEKGVRPKGQGKRSDIEAATDILSNGGSLQEVAQSLPSVFVKFHRGLRNIS